MKKFLLLSAFFLLISSNTANASVLFSDDFNSGLNPIAWTSENEKGSVWDVQYSGTNGYLQSQRTYGPVVYALVDDRYLDILSNRNNFANYTMSFDINFLNQGFNQDWRRIYLRANGSFDSHSGYAIDIRHWDGAGEDFVAIGSYESNTLNIIPYDKSFNPLSNNEWYRFLVSLDGNDLKLKYWKLSESEPSSWLFNVKDLNNTYTQGGIGFGNYWQADTLIDNVKVNVTPEPASMILFGFGGVAMAFRRFRQKKI